MALIGDKVVYVEDVTGRYTTVSEGTIEEVSSEDGFQYYKIGGQMINSFYVFDANDKDAVIDALKTRQTLLDAYADSIKLIHKLHNK